MKQDPNAPSWVDSVNDRLASAMGWGLLAMVVVTFLIVCLRYILNVGWVWLQEIVLYTHAAVFLLSMASVLRKDGHVRVDVFYRGLLQRRKDQVDGLGAFLLLIPTCAVILYTSIPYVLDSWRVFEGSKDGGGLEAVFLLKSLIPLFALLLLMQGLRMGLRDWRRWRRANA
ncbi:MAG: TRAP transporter small permease subunit [Bdellovibrionales bacterium]|nr:TRAP transporter small permease subunit [Bdellovibrionales bacterium]